MPLFRALAKNMVPITNTDESPTNRLTLPYAFSYLPVSLSSIYSLVIVNNERDGLETH